MISSSLPERLRAGLWNKHAATAFGDFLKDLNPSDTVVHFHSFQVELTASTVKLASDLGFEVIFTAHDYGIACPYSGFFNRNSGAPCGKVGLSIGCATTLCNEGKSVPGKAYHHLHGLIQRSKGKVPSGFKNFVFVSEFSRHILKPYLPLQAKTWIVRNALNFKDLGPRTLQPNAPFLYVGRLTREKGVDLLARASARAKIPVQFVGTGDLEAEILQLNPAAQSLGWKNHEQIRGLMEAARALVFPSRWYEGQPLVVQEAQSVGLPIIVSDISAATDTVEHGVTGLHFRSNDVEALEEALAKLTDDELAVRQGSASYRAYWLDPPTEEKHVESTLSVYEQVLS